MNQCTSPETNRRGFLASLAGAVSTSMIGSIASAAESRRSPNDRIQVGVIGLGSRGYNLIDAFIAHDDRTRITAICDVDLTHYRDRPWGTGTAFGLIPAKKKIETAYSKRKSGLGDNRLDTYRDFRELIAREDVDAVVVATPDHWHALCFLTALRAGKDVYCEKPVTHFFSEGQRVYQEAQKHNAVFQTGSQQRSDWRFRRAVELVRGRHLGAIKEFKVGLPPGYDKPQGDTRAEKIPTQLDYDFWSGPAPMLPYTRARHHRWWRGHLGYVSNTVGRPLRWDPHSETVVGDGQADELLREMTYREPWSL